MFDKASTSVSVFAGSSEQGRTLATQLRTFKRCYLPGFLPVSRYGVYRNRLEALRLEKPLVGLEASRWLPAKAADSGRTIAS